MTVQRGGKEYNTFVAGIITEANELTFPENASKDEANMELYRDGSRQRRLGMDYEEDHVDIDTNYLASVMESASVSSYKWEAVGNDANLDIVVVQIRNQLWFADANAQPITGTLYNGGFSLAIAGATAGDIQFSSVNGVLVGVNEGIDPFYLSYNAATDTVTKTNITLKGRDLYGIADGYDIDERPASLSAFHQYNLQNQGWTATNITAFHTSQSVYPSNADIQHLGKDSTDTFDAALLVKQFFGSGQAPRGRYIISLFDRGASRTAESGVAALPADREEGRPTTVATYGERVFYAGVSSRITGADARSTPYSGTVFFTRVVSSNNDLGACYQDADPSSEHIADIVDSDGGFINISGAHNIYKLESTKSSLVVFAENGVWEIYGDTGGFNATGYQVNKVTNVGCVGNRSVVAAEDLILYWSKGGIYALSPDQVSGRLVAQNITEATIQTLYNAIPGVAKRSAEGLFDSASRKITWLYNNSSDYDPTSYGYKKNKELVFDTALRAFYVRTINELNLNSPFVVSSIITNNFISANTISKVVVGADDIVVDEENVISGRVSRSRGTTSTVYLTLQPSTDANYKWTISAYRNANFIDWFSEDLVGVDAAAFLDTGQELFGDTQRRKKVTSISFHFKRTETGFVSDSGDLALENPSSCLVQARWGFSNNVSSGRYGNQFQAYRLPRAYQPEDVNDDFDQGFSVITTRNKLRGHGKALSLNITTEPGKDLYLLGWGETHTVALAT